MGTKVSRLRLFFIVDRVFKVSMRLDFKLIGKRE